MCGICGIVYNDRAHPVNERTLVAMRDALVHRGPDDAGFYVDPGIALGSRRLSIIDLSERGHMPMSTPDGRYWITYNGEVYNYRELRTTLEARGHTFRSNTDTEVILRLYANDGPAMLDRLNGMFALAIWDSRDRTLFVARDRLGVKPLYYAQQAGAFYFASEQKALFAAGVQPEFDTNTWEELVCFRYVAGERTPYVGVKRLLPGHFLLWKDGEVKIRRWWNLAERVRDQRESQPRDVQQWFLETFNSAVDLRRISDVPIGVLLSGGLDSSCVAASLAMQGGSGLSSFTVRFAEREYDEGPVAQQVAERFKFDYHELTVSTDELLSWLYKSSWMSDEPLTHASSLHIWAISKYAKPRVTVLLSGEGSDETLGGYVRYQPLRHPFLLKTARPIMPRVISGLGKNGRWRKLGRFLDLGSIDRFVLFNTCDVLPGDLESIGMIAKEDFKYRNQVLAEAKDLYPAEPMRQAMYSDQHTFLCSLLDRNDRMTMGASIECRVPFLDYRLVEGVGALPSSALLAGKGSKPLLRNSIGQELPKGVQEHRKWGFGVPWKYYLRQVPELRAIVTELPDMNPFLDGPFDRARMRSVVSGFLRGNSQHEELVRQLVMIGVWYQACFDRSRLTNQVVTSDYSYA